MDGAYDFSVFGHEFGHLIENRMIAKGVGTRQGTHAGSMGEAFGDFDALAAFNELHLPIPTGSTKYTEGAYATGNGYNGIRDFLAGEPMGGTFPAPGQNPHTDPLNYGDFGFDIVGTEVHADGEIWVAVEIALRELFLTNAMSHGFPAPTEALDVSCAHGQTAPDACPGDRRWITDYYDSMVIMPRGPTMIQARDAMLAADLARYTADPAWGDNHDLIWQGFAMYGFGNTSNTVSERRRQPGARVRRAGGCRHQQRDDQLLRRLEGGQRGSGQRADLRGRLLRPVDPDRGHEPGDGQRRHERHQQPRQRRADRAQRRGLARGRHGRGEQPLAVLQLRRRRARLRHRPLPGEEPQGGRGPEHHDPPADQLRVGDAGRDGHDRRSRDRDERDPAT